MRKFFAFLLLLIFISVFISTIITWNIKSTLLNEEFVKEELSKNQVYEFIHDEAFPNLIAELESEDIEGVSATGVFTAKDFTSLLQNSISVKFLQTEAEEAIDNTYPFFLSQKNNFEITLDLETVKKSFGDSFTKLIKTKIKKLPACSESQLFEVDENTSTGEILCIPPPLTSGEIIKTLDLSRLEKEILNELPDKLFITNERIITKSESSKLLSNLEWSDNYPQDTKDTLAEIREGITLFKLASNVLIVSSVIILILIAALRYGSVRSMTRWVGWALLLPSFLVLSTTLFVNLFLISSLSGFFSSLFSEIFDLGSSSQDVQFIEFFIGSGEKLGLVLNVVKDINQQILIQTAVVFVVALILIIGSVFIKSKETRDLPQIKK
jgi:hypothetical protein